MNTPDREIDLGESLISPQLLRLTVYISLLVGHIIFGILHPDSIVVAALGFTFFAVLIIRQLRPDTHSSQLPRDANKLDDHRSLR
jgi:hypothetical protein